MLCLGLLFTGGQQLLESGFDATEQSGLFLGSELGGVVLVIVVCLVGIGHLMSSHRPRTRPMQ
jgi:tetrahydromethanopterin S-methyltransferase subunit F